MYILNPDLYCPNCKAENYSRRFTSTIVSLFFLLLFLLVSILLFYYLLFTGCCIGGFLLYVSCHILLCLYITSTSF